MRTALIAGGGIGGLAAGIALRRAGWRVRIFERAATPREVGFALNLAANAMAALTELGVADRVLGGGHRTMHAEIRTGSGRRLKRVDLPSAIRGACAIVATRPVLHGALLDAIGPEPLVVDSEVVGFETTDTGVTLILAGGARESGDVLIGADGVKSVIRHVLHPDEPPPSASGYCALRGVTGDVTERMGDVSAVTYLGRGIEASIARAGMGALYWYMSLLAREVPSGTSPPVVAERFLDRLDGTFRAVVRATQPEDMRFDVLYEREPLESWGRGVVTLLGDAAHPMLPHTGQGAAQALEDAVALGLVLAGHGADVPAALRRYEHVRAARTKRLIARGRRAARATTTHSALTTLVRTALIRIVPATRMARMFMMAGEGDPHRELR